jgi:large subunit ribosomal protein L1
MQHSKKLTKHMSAAYCQVAREKNYTPEEAIAILKKVQFVKFDSSLEISMKLGISEKQSGQMVRGVVSLPAGTGKLIRVAVICKEEDISSCSQADIVGGTELIDEIANGRLDFDVCIATPAMMGYLGRVAKILGPKGLMPNPKLGTVTQNPAEAVSNAKAGQVEFRSDKGGNLNCGLGKLSFATDRLYSNLEALIAAVVKARPVGAKGEYIKSSFLSSTMGPSLRIDISGLYNNPT